MAADQADAQVYPPTTCLQAFLTSLGVGCDVANLVKMCAGHHRLSVERLTAYFERQSDNKARVPRLGPYVYAAVMLLDNALADVQAQASAYTGLLGGKERLE
jgi:hypothetical protein